MADNISDSEFLARLAGETNHTLLSPNTDGNISDPEFLVHLSGEMDQTLEVMKEIEAEKKISRKMSNDGAIEGGTKSIKALVEGVADGMVGIFTPLHDRTYIPYIDDDHPLFDMPLPMIQHIITLPHHEREELLKRIYDGDTMGVHDELASKGVPVVIEM